MHLTLTFSPRHKINRVPSVIIYNLLAKFESDWPNAVSYIVPTRFYTECDKFEFELDLQPHDPKSIGFLFSSLKTVHVKCKSNRAITVVCIVCTRQSAMDSKTHVRIDAPTHQTTHEQPRYYILINAVAKG